MGIVITDLVLHLTMELSTRVSGRATRGMVMGSKSGQMVLCMKATGRVTWLMGQAPFCICMAISIRVNGSGTKLMDKEYTHIAMELSIMESGKMICSTVSELKPGETSPNTKANTQKVKSTV